MIHFQKKADSMWSIWAKNDWKQIEFQLSALKFRSIYVCEKMVRKENDEKLI